jgi:hypothetical protein
LARARFWAPLWAIKRQKCEEQIQQSVSTLQQEELDKMKDQRWKRGWGDLSSDIIILPTDLSARRSAQTPYFSPLLQHFKLLSLSTFHFSHYQASRFISSLNSVIHLNISIAFAQCLK